jgi:hypothetical protein
VVAPPVIEDVVLNALHSIITPPVLPQHVLVAAPKMVHMPEHLSTQSIAMIAPMIEEEPVLSPVEENIPAVLTSRISIITPPVFPLSIIHPVTPLATKKEQVSHTLHVMTNTHKRLSATNDMISSAKIGGQEILPSMTIRTPLPLAILPVMTQAISCGIFSPLVNLTTAILPAPVTRALTHWTVETGQIIHSMKHLAVEEVERWVVTDSAPKIMAEKIQSHFPTSPREWERFFENLLGLTLIYLTGFGLMKILTQATRLFGKREHTLLAH